MKSRNIDPEDVLKEPDHKPYEAQILIGRYCRVPELSVTPDTFTRASGFDVRARATLRGLMKPGTTELIAFEREQFDGETFWTDARRREVEVEIAADGGAANDAPSEAARLEAEIVAAVRARTAALRTPVLQDCSEAIDEMLAPFRSRR